MKIHVFLLGGVELLKGNRLLENNHLLANANFTVESMAFLTQRLSFPNAKPRVFFFLLRVLRLAMENHEPEAKRRKVAV